MMTDSAVPIRSSASDPDFDPDFGRRLVIKLDGVEQAKVVAYDLEAQTIERCVLDADGNIQLNEARDEVLLEVVTGKVEVTLASEPTD